MCKAAYPSEGTLVAMKQVCQLINEGIVVWGIVERDPENLILYTICA